MSTQEILAQRRKTEDEELLRPLQEGIRNLRFIQEVQEKELKRRNRFIKDLQNDYFEELKNSSDGVFVRRWVETTRPFDYSRLEMWDENPGKIKTLREGNSSDIILGLFYAGCIDYIGLFGGYEGVFDNIITEVDKIPQSPVVTGLSFYIKGEFVKALEKFIIGDDALSQYFVGRCFERGEGFHKNEIEALEWYLKAAEQGNGMAQCQAGIILKSKVNKPQNIDLAVKWFQKSVEKENSVAQFHLATCYLNGQGVGKNIEKAKRSCIFWLVFKGISKQRHSIKSLIANHNKSHNIQATNHEIHAQKDIIIIFRWNAAPQTIPIGMSLTQPKTHIPLTSEQGKQLFLQTATSKRPYTNSFWKLSQNFESQITPSYCGVASTVMVLNSLGSTRDYRPKSSFVPSYAFFDQQNLFATKEQLEIKTSASARGMQFDELEYLLNTYPGVATKSLKGVDSNLDEFSATCKAALLQDDTFVVLYYDRAVLEEDGSYHISLIGGYNEEHDMFLRMDVARVKYESAWIPRKDLWRSINCSSKLLTGYQGGIIVCKSESSSNRHQKIHISPVNLARRMMLIALLIFMLGLALGASLVYFFKK